MTLKRYFSSTQHAQYFLLLGPFSENHRAACDVVNFVKPAARLAPTTKLITFKVTKVPSLPHSDACFQLEVNFAVLIHTHGVAAMQLAD